MNLIKNKQVLSVFGIAAGLALIIAGVFLRNEELKYLSGVCIGLGAGLTGAFIATFITYKMESQNKEALRKKNIEVNDERNTTIRDKAGAKTNKVLMRLLFIVTLVFALLDVKLYITLTMVGFIILEGILYIAYTNYFNKRL